MTVRQRELGRSESTVIVDAYMEATVANGSNRPNYKGLLIHALPGLHPFVADLVVKHLRPGATILELAAGSGAMAQRLTDAGFNVTATDYVSENFRLHGKVPFFQSNLNERFAASVPGEVDAIVALEIIEHLENPRHFARECFSVLPAGGHLILSTPNIDCSVSKAMFTRSGCFLWFDEAEYHASGHITPIAQKQLHEVIREAGFEFLWEGSFGNAMDRIAGSPRLLMLSKLLGWLNVNPIDGEIYVCVLRKPIATIA